MNEEIVNLFKQGDGSIKYVFDRTGLSYGKIKKILNSYNVNYTNPRFLIDNDKSQLIKNMLDSGLGYSEISEKTGIKYTTLYKFCKKNNWRPSKHSNSINEKEYLPLIEKYANLGESKTFIAKKANISRETVFKICENNGISLTDKTSYPIDKEAIIEYVEKLGYKVLSVSKKHNKNTVKAIHNKCGNIRNTSFWDYEKHDCKSCSYTGISKDETEIKEWIEKNGIKTDKIKIQGKEIDIYMPSLNLGIEYCGLYWHSEKFDTDKNRHYSKMRLCNDNGIRLITIFEDEWAERQPQVKNFLKSVMGIYDKKVFARKCQIKEVPKEIAKEFLEDHHIQGKTVMEVAIGLYNNDNLVGLVTGNKHHRQGHDSLFVLNRLVFKDGVQIVGGASKLLKYLINYTKDKNYDKLISWSDNRWSEGNVYIKTGFKLTENLSPDYSYSIGGKLRKSKQSCKKKNLIGFGAVNDMKKTERELAKTINYYRIWDCGKKRWEIELK